MTLLGFVALTFAIAAWLWAHRRGTPPSKYVLFILMAATAVETVGVVTAFTGDHNLIYYNIYLFIEFALMLLLARDHWTLQGRNLGALALLLLYATCFVGEWSIVDGNEQFLSRTFVLGGLVLVVLFMLLLFKLANSDRERLLAQPEFWLFFAVVVYFGCMIPNNGLMNYLVVRDEALSLRLLAINKVFSVVRSLMLAVACLLYYRPLVRAS